MDSVQRGRKEHRFGWKCHGPRWFWTEVTRNRFLLVNCLVKNNGVQTIWKLPTLRKCEFFKLFWLDLTWNLSEFTQEKCFILVWDLVAQKSMFFSNFQCNFCQKSVPDHMSGSSKILLGRSEFLSDMSDGPTKFHEDWTSVVYCGSKASTQTNKIRKHGAGCSKLMTSLTIQIYIYCYFCWKNVRIFCNAHFSNKESSVIWLYQHLNSKWIGLLTTFLC